MPDEHDDELDLGAGEQTSKSTKRSPGRPRKETVRAEQAGDLRKVIGESLGELAEWIGNRDPELALILKRDGPRMADVLASRAARHENLAGVLKRGFGKDGMFGVLRAFGPTVRELAGRARSARARLYDEGEQLDEQAAGAHGDVAS